VRAAKALGRHNVAGRFSTGQVDKAFVHKPDDSE
jgi:hypothetical protein